MSGYTPLFSTLTTGTLCGRWPDIGLWPIVLSMTDWQGVVDVTPAYISGVTGLPVGEVAACMKRFCKPDPHSRSDAEGGARLVLLDEHRDWGWRVVNIQIYRDKASGKDQVDDGRNREKVKRYKERHRRTPEDTGGHPATPTHTTDSDSDSDSDSDQDKNPEKKKTKNARAREGDLDSPPEALAPGLDPIAWSRWFEYRKQSKKPIRTPSVAAAQRELAAHGTNQGAVVEHSIANSYQGLYAPKNLPAPKNVGRNADGSVLMFNGKPVEWQ